MIVKALVVLKEFFAKKTQSTTNHRQTWPILTKIHAGQIYFLEIHFLSF